MPVEGAEVVLERAGHIHVRRTLAVALEQAVARLDRSSANVAERRFGEIPEHRASPPAAEELPRERRCVADDRSLWAVPVDERLDAAAPARDREHARELPV